MYKGKPIKITADFSTESLKERRAWSDVIQALNENNFNNTSKRPYIMTKLVSIQGFKDGSAYIHL
jgi:hypothetical protein